MTIYECLGIDHFLMDEQIPVDFIIENINNESLRNDAEFYFRVIDRVSIRASIARGDHYLQVLEVQLNSPDYVQEISFAIQKAIKYRVFFVFIYKNRYLLVRRSFNLTMSTENVYTYNASFCSDWIYEEYLNLDILYNLPFRTIAEYDEANAEAVELLKTDRDNGDYILFKEFLYLAEWLNRCIVESECISVRWFIDWLKAHIAGQRIELSDFIDRIHEHEACQFIGDYLFIDKNCARTAISELDNESLFTLSMDHTGKQPMSYFDGIGEPATFEEADELSQALQFGSGDFLYLESQANKALKKRRLWDEHQKEFEQKRRKATQRAAADERRRIDDWWIEWERKHLHKQEEPIEDIGTTVIPMNPDVCFEDNGNTQNTEDQRFLEEERRKAEEQRCLEEERRKAEEQRRLKEERRKAEEQRRLEEERLKVEEQRRLEEERLKVEEQRRLEEERCKAEEQRRLEQERCKAEEQRRLEEERRKVEEQRRLEAEQKKAEERRLREEEIQRAREQRRLLEEQKKAEARKLRREERQQAEEQKRLEHARQIKEKYEQEYLERHEEVIREEQIRRRIEWRQKAAEREQAIQQRAEAKEKDEVYQTALPLIMSNDIALLKEGIRMLETISGWKDSKKLIRKANDSINILVKEQQRALYRSQKLCQYCGGKFNGFFKKVCSNCGRSKDY